MQWKFALAFVCVCAVWFDLAQGAGRNRSKNRTENNPTKSKSVKAKWTCQNTKHNVTATEISKGLKIACRRKSVITDVIIKGHNGSCVGLTADIFVQSMRCVWRKDCSLNYNALAKNYMVKLLQGSYTCVVKSPQYFIFSYSCTNKTDNSSILSLSEEHPTTTTDKKKGIVRSHVHYPWMYKGGQTKYTSSLNLSRPRDHHLFFYTFRDFHLSENDTVTVSSGADVITFTHENSSSVGDDASKLSGKLKSGERVTISLEVKHSSRGGDGFLMCFAWSKEDKPDNGYDVCGTERLINTQKCKTRKG